MRPEINEPIVRRIMDAFGRRTGLTSNVRPKRYLWTDAFAVCNYLTLHGVSGEAHDLERARRLVDQVHRVLGRHRDDDPRTGWISGLSEDEGERHPTAGGLRIGKRLNERRPGEPYDRHLEWDRDGQYFHYLTRWAEALERMAERTGEARYHRWAVELLAATVPAFLRAGSAGGVRRMVWKTSIDLERPLVETQGAHDPLDGLVVAAELRSAGHAGSEGTEGDALDEPIAVLRDLCRDRRWATDDPLATGGLLAALARVIELSEREEGVWDELAAELAEDAAASLERWLGGRPFRRPIAGRLAFRELGLALGLQAVARYVEAEAGAPTGREDRRPVREHGRPGRSVPSEAAALRPYLSLASEIERTWLGPDARATEGWSAHRDINEVMLATSLLPGGWLGDEAPAPARRSS